jgi:hypothetical protein
MELVIQQKYGRIAFCLKLVLSENNNLMPQRNPKVKISLLTYIIAIPFSNPNFVQYNHLDFNLHFPDASQTQ